MSPIKAKHLNVPVAKHVQSVRSLACKGLQLYLESFLMSLWISSISCCCLCDLYHLSITAGSSVSVSSALSAEAISRHHHQQCLDSAGDPLFCRSGPMPPWLKLSLGRVSPNKSLITTTSSVIINISLHFIHRVSADWNTLIRTHPSSQKTQQQWKLVPQADKECNSTAWMLMTVSEMIIHSLFLCAKIKEKTVCGWRVCPKHVSADLRASLYMKRNTERGLLFARITFVLSFIHTGRSERSFHS